jgi:hypothetical protein
MRRWRTRSGEGLLRQTSRSVLAALVSAAFALSGCADAPSLGSNPDGLPYYAQSLEFVISEGCLPLVLKEKSEAEAMRDIGMRRDALQSWGEPSPWGHHYIGGFRGGVRGVTVVKASCFVIIEGKDFGSYEKAADLAFRRRFGPDYASTPLPASFRPSRPGSIMFCRDKVVVMVGPDALGPFNRRDDAFDVELEPVWPGAPKLDCAS